METFAWESSRSSFKAEITLTQNICFKIVKQHQRVLRDSVKSEL